MPEEIKNLKKRLRRIEEAIAAAASLDFSIRLNTKFDDDLSASEQAIDDLIAGLASRLNSQEIAEEKLRRNENKFLNFYKSMNEGVCLNELLYDDNETAYDYRILDVNPYYERIMDKKREEVVNRLGTQVYDGDSPPYLDVYARVAKSRQGESFENYFEPLEKYLSISVFSPVKNQVGMVFSDITRRKLIEMELRQAHKLESVGQLAAGIAHEINTPSQFVGDNIRFIKDAIQTLLDLQQKEKKLIEMAHKDSITSDLLQEIDDAIEQADLEYFSKELPEAIDQSLDGVQRISKIVRAMKEFSHPGSEEMEESDLNKAIMTTITVTRNEWKYCADLRTDLDPDLPAVPCLPGEFNQVMLNMIINARDAIIEKFGKDSEKKGLITISSTVVGNLAEVRISDNGIGMEDDVRRRIFDPFFTTKEVGSGSGQGLSIGHNLIVCKHNGEFHVNSKPGRGTTFIIRLPLVQNQKGAA